MGESTTGRASEGEPGSPGAGAPASTYRPDIDGLRAVAVLSVVLYHLDASWVPGGYIGVDIFFVISSYLITRNIAESVRQGSFSMREFYRRRIQRIFPALFVVVMATLLLGQLILLPQDLSRLAESAVFSQLSLANVYFTFSLDTSYFAADASLEPLLHLWSLGVEEQFYLLWPLVLVEGLGLPRRRRFLVALGVLMVCSFAAAEILTGAAPMFSYYMLPTRVGQFVAGAFCYFSARRVASLALPRWVPEGAGLAGAGLVLASLVLLDGETAFPGLNAVPVTLGAALIIFGGSVGSGSPALVRRFLGLPPMVLVGLMSYSFYLWHWPLLAFWKYAFGEVHPALRAPGLLLIGGVSYLSYRWVERPCRAQKGSLGRAVRRFLLLPTAAVVAAGVFLMATGGLGLDWNDHEYRAALSEARATEPEEGLFPFVCQDWKFDDRYLEDPVCVVGGTAEPEVLLWGDSNAAHYVGILGEIADELGFSFRNIAHLACPPLLDRPERFVTAPVVEGCRHSNAVVQRHLPRFHTVILGGNWDVYQERRPDLLGPSLERTVEALRGSGKEVVLLGRVPRIESLDRSCGQKALKLPFLNCRESAATSRAMVESTNSSLREIARRTGATYYDVSEVLCDGGRCSGYLDNRLVYRDPGHLDVEGSIRVGVIARRLESSRRAFGFLGGRQDGAAGVPPPWRGASAAGPYAPSFSQSLSGASSAIARPPSEPL